MEINTQHMDALLPLHEQQTALGRKEQHKGTGFDAMLSQQMQNANAGRADTTAAGTAQIGLYNQIMFEAVEQKENLDPDSAVLQAAFDQASGTLDLWDSYTRTLGTSTDTALRDAWGMLESIDAQVSQLRANPATAKSSALDSLVNELAILTATEKFKFNRGDYAA